MVVVPDWGKWKNRRSGESPNPQDQPGDDDDPGPYQGVEDEKEDVSDDRRKAPPNGGRRDPDDNEDEPLGDPDV